MAFRKRKLSGSMRKSIRTVGLFHVSVFLLRLLLPYTEENRHTFHASIRKILKQNISGIFAGKNSPYQIFWQCRIFFALHTSHLLYCRLLALNDKNEHIRRWHDIEIAGTLLGIIAPYHHHRHTQLSLRNTHLYEIVERKCIHIMVLRHCWTLLNTRFYKRRINSYPQIGWICRHCFPKSGKLKGFVRSKIAQICGHTFKQRSALAKNNTSSFSCWF